MVELQASKGQHLSDVTHVGFVHGRRATQVALVLRGLLGQDVALERLTALDGATRTNAKTLFRAALGLHFGHVIAPFKMSQGRQRFLAALVQPLETNKPADDQIGGLELQKAR